MEITPGIRRIGAGLVNVYLLEEAGAVTIVDAGAPGYWRDLPRELAAMGRTLGDVRSVVLTHGHRDHLGFAERIRRERGVPIRVHEVDADLVRGEAKRSPDPRGSGIRGLKISKIPESIVFLLSNGMMRIPPVREVVTFGDGATLDIPGTPRVIHLPGHTAGSAALYVPSKDAILIGDAIVTLNFVTRATGPQIAPRGEDLHLALESLGRLDSIEAGLVLPGHGQPWTGGLSEAIRQVRAGRSY